MASVQTSKYDGRYLKLTVTEESTSIEINTSTIKWLLESIGGNSNYYNIYDCKVTVNGQVVYGPVTKTWDSKVFPAAKGSTSGTLTVAHNADGTAPNVSFTLRGSVYYNNPQNYSDSIPLTTIPRASSITVLDANIGSSTNITINKASSNFTTTLYYKASGQNSWTKIVDKTSNQVYGWTVPTSFYCLFPNSKTIACQFYAETYLDGNYVGTSSIITAIFTATGIPTINSIAAIDTNSTTINLTGNSANMVRYASNVKITVSASGVNSASISSIKVNGTTASSGVVTFNSCTTNSFEIAVTDSRGYTRTQIKTMTMINYVPLTLSASIVRNLPTDGKIKISYSGNYFNGSFGSQSNTLTVQYRYKLKGGSFGSWTNLSPTKSGNTYYQNNYIISGFNYTNQYEFEIRAIDKINTVSIIGISVSKGKPVLYWEDELVGVNGNLNVSGTFYASGVKGSYTSNGGQQNPNYFGTNKVGFLMMNTSVNGDSHYKDWLIMDCYSGNDVGGAVAFGIDRQEMKAFIMGSDASRTSWTRSAELLKTSDILNKIYPVGSIYLSVNSTNPANLFGGTWVQLKDRFLLGAGDTYSNGSTGGESTHTLTIDEMPQHNHIQSWAGNDHTTNNLVTDKASGSQSDRNVFGTGSGCRYNSQSAWHNSGATIVGTGFRGSSSSHNNMPPYLTVYMWKRTA